MSNAIIVTGGGSGGHVYPGIAVVESLKGREDIEIYWLGSKKGIEKKILEEFDIPFYGIPSGKFRRYLSYRNILDVFKIIFGIIAAFFLLLKLKPRLLFSKGGYVSVPPVLAARMLGIPVFSHESDFDPGLATRINSRFSEKIFLSYPESAGYFPASYRAKIEITGNPVRESIENGNSNLGKKILGCTLTKPLLLVLGGSQGARQINRLIWKNLDTLCRTAFVVHQFGARETEIPVREGYFAKEYFNEEFPHILAAADLIISRAGAGTLWEAAANSKPLILLPLEGSATRGDQIRNAEYFEKKGAALVIREESGEQERLAEIVERTMRDTELLAELGDAIGGMYPESAAERIAAKILERVEA